MKNFFSLIIIFAVLLIGAGWVYTQQAEEKTRVKISEDLASARRNFASKARAAANESDTDAYLRSIRASLAAYKEELDSRVYKGHSKMRDAAAYRKKVEQQFAKGEIDEARKKSMLEGYDLVKEAHDILLSGKWSPVLSAKGGGETRLDLYTLTKITDTDGRPVLEGKFFLWGVEDGTDVRWGSLGMRIWKREMAEVKEGGKKVMKEVDQVLGKSEGEAQPHVLVQSPQKYIDEFPSYVSIGYLWFPALPKEAVAVDIDYDFRVKSPGGSEVESMMKWEKLEAVASWKLKDGEVWEADEIEATEEEIRGIPAKDQPGQEEAPEE